MRTESNGRGCLNIVFFCIVLAMLAFVMVTLAAVDTGVVGAAPLSETNQTYTLNLSPDTALLQPLMCNAGNSCTLIAGVSGWVNVQLDNAGTVASNTVACGNYSCASVKVEAGQSVVVLGSPVVYANLTLTPRFTNWASYHVYLPQVTR